MAEEYGQPEWREDHEAALAEAQRRIAVAEIDGADTLDLADLGALRELPAALSNLTNLRRLFLGWRSAEGAWVGVSFKVITDISALSGLTGLTLLDLHYTLVDDLSPLAGMTNLTSLDLSDTHVSDLSILSSLTGLTTLRLSGVRAHDFSVLSDLTDLISLDLSSTALRDLSILSSLTKLTSLNLSATPVSDISVLSNLMELDSLNLSYTQISDLSALSGLSGLVSLNLSGAKFSDISALSILRGLNSLRLSSTKVNNISALSGLTNLTSLDLSNTRVSDFSVLTKLPGLSSLELRSTGMNDLSVLFALPAFAEERATFLQFQDTPAADPDVDRRLYMLSRLDGQRCAVETVQYLKGTHPDFREPPGGAAPAPLAARLASASPVWIEERDGLLEAVNPGTPERPAPKELHIRVEALRAHVDQLLTEARGKQVPAALLVRLEHYQRPLALEEPTYLLLDGPMAFLRGGMQDRYVTEGLEAGFVAGWRQLVAMHDDLRPLLLPPEEDMPDLPDLLPDATAETGLDLADRAIDVLGSDAAAETIGQSVVEALRAAKEYFEVAKADEIRRPGLLRRGFRAVGGIVGLLVGGTGLAASAMTIQLWAATPQGQTIIALLRPIFDAILKMFGA